MGYNGAQEVKNGHIITIFWQGNNVTGCFIISKPRLPFDMKQRFKITKNKFQRIFFYLLSFKSKGGFLGAKVFLTEQCTSYIPCLTDICK